MFNFIKKKIDFLKLSKNPLQKIDKYKHIYFKKCLKIRLDQKKRINGIKKYQKKNYIL